jgi:hypothetical protein
LPSFQQTGLSFNDISRNSLLGPGKYTEDIWVGTWKIEGKIAEQIMTTFVYRSNGIFLWHTNKANGITGKN